MKQELTQEYLKSILNYNPETGIFTWRKRISHLREVGDVAGYFDRKNGYSRIIIKGARFNAHNLAYFLVYGVLLKNIDHINGVKNDNRILNLRESTISENCMNRIISSNNTSGVKGVSWDKTRQRWVARICANGRNFHIGWYEDLNDAKKSIKIARERLHGEFSNHG